MQHQIEQYFAEKEQFSANNAPYELKQILEDILDKLNDGTLRVSEKHQGQWVTHAWIKQAILLCFRIFPNQVMPGGLTPYYDKVALKYQSFNEQDFLQQQARIVPHAIVRNGAFIGKNCIIMPS